MRGALNVAYGHSDVTYKGPFPSQFHVTGSGAQRTVTIQYDNGRASLSIRDTKGFEVRDARELRNVSLVTTPTSFPLYLLRSECTMHGLIEPMANCQAAHVTTMNVFVPSFMSAGLLRWGECPQLYRPGNKVGGRTNHKPPRLAGDYFRFRLQCGQGLGSALRVEDHTLSLQTVCCVCRRYKSTCSTLPYQHSAFLTWEPSISLNEI